MVLINSASCSALFDIAFFKCLYQHIYLSASSEEISLGIDHAEEMELLLDNYYLQVEWSRIN